jgi:hypothetical protein
VKRPEFIALLAGGMAARGARAAGRDAAFLNKKSTIS